MGWIAGIGSVVGGLASAYGASQGSKQSTLPASFYNAYGQLNTPNTGAISSMNNIFNSINGTGFGAQTQGASQDLVNSLRGAANSPQLGAANAYNSDVLSGKYLNSPQVTDYANKAYSSIIGQGANQNARTQANFANNGLGFSTGMQQAQQANGAATAGQAATTRAGILSSNYQNERQLQQGAVGNAESLVSQAPNYLSQINSALYAPYNSQAGLTTGLLGQQTNNPQPTYVQQPNIGNVIGQGTGTAAGLYQLFQNLQQKNGGGNPGNSTGGTGENDMTAPGE